MADTVVFVHAHPDDEAIFTGGTMLLASRAGVRVVLVVATSGERGAATAEASGAGTATLGERRRAETADAADLLGVDTVRFLPFGDSGMAGDGPAPAGSLCAASPADVTSTLAAVLAVENPVAVVTYDDTGIYGHPDHVAVHRASVAAAATVGIATVYEATVDREYLHFVETHLVVEAGVGPRPADLGLASTSLGSPTVMIDVTVDVSDVLDAKRAAMAAHESQIPETSSAMQLPTGDFAAVYRYEWYRRTGPVGPLEALPRL
ncbi:MAG: PIG-L deacetylase family protein [Acidimicrobiales bacterium]